MTWSAAALTQNPNPNPQNLYPFLPPGASSLLTQKSKTAALKPFSSKLLPFYIKQTLNTYVFFLSCLFTAFITLQNIITSFTYNFKHCLKYFYRYESFPTLVTNLTEYSEKQDATSWAIQHIHPIYKYYRPTARHWKFESYQKPYFIYKYRSLLQIKYFW